MVRNYKRKSDRFKWSKENLDRAADYVKFGSVSVREAAIKYNIPKSTLQRFLKGNVESGKRDAFTTVFSKEMEDELVNHALKLKGLMYGLTGDDLRSLAFEFAERNKIKHPFPKDKKKAGADWLRHFMSRHPELSFHTPEKTSLSRITGFNKVQTMKFYELVRKAMEEHHFEPQRIYNVDETGMSTVPNRTSKVIAKKGVKQVGQITSAEKGQTTTLVCAMNAAGSFIPPVFIFARKNMNAQLMRNAPVGAIGLCSDSGWMNTDLFPKWLDHFIDHTKSSTEDKVLLILDNHVSHCSIEAIKKARENGVVMITIPPHTSHKTQPLDRTFYGPLKTAYEQECHKFMVNHPGKRITQYDIAELVGQAYPRCASVEKGIKGFQCTGIYPFNPDIFDETDYAPAELTERNVENCEGLHETVDSGNTTLATGHDTLTPAHNFEPVPGTSKADEDNDPPIQAPFPEASSSDEGTSSGSSTTVSIEDISPIPRVERSNNARKRAAGKAEELTSSPYKARLLQQLENKKSKGRKGNQKTANQGGKKKTGGKNQSKSDMSGGKSAQNTTSEYECIFCSEQYVEPITEDWIQCSSCKEWCHERCADLESGKDDFICDLCSDHDQD
ncbi:tigger transposable element-derived protein 4-like [Liolophura sinensis]|uniref:tigger transposable element-derived protein 4-like n=1 Tax=Liolophura sinensis TaxID=3198878 RepID=UPI003158879B